MESVIQMERKNAVCILERKFYSMGFYTMSFKALIIKV